MPVSTTRTGVALTPAGASLYDEARTLLAQADQVRARVAAAAGTATITIGTLADVLWNGTIGLATIAHAPARSSARSYESPRPSTARPEPPPSNAVTPG
jgi:hypothetical protein